MKVILLQDVRGVGQKNDVKNVADGYAMNFLLPEKLAEAATEDKVASLESERAEREKEREAATEKLRQSIAAMNNTRVEITARATEKGGLFKSIGVSDIAGAIEKKLDIQIPEESITLSSPIKTTGEHSVVVREGKVSATIIVAIIPQE